MVEETQTNLSPENKHTAAIFDELGNRFLEAMRVESERINTQAEQESTRKMAEAEEQATRITHEALRAAREEANKIITEARQLAESESARLLATAKSCVEQTISQLGVSLQAANEMKLRLENELATSPQRTKMEAGATQSIAITTPPPAAPKSEPPAAAPPPPPSPHRKGGNGSHHHVALEKPFSGTVELQLVGTAGSLSQQVLTDMLAKTYGLEMLLTSPTEKGTKVMFFLPKPLPLLKMLKQMASVEEAYEEDNTIYVKLAQNPPWVG